MKVRGLLYALTGVAVLLSSCGKGDYQVTGTDYNYTFVNNTDKPINVDIYKTATDYANNQNIYLHGVADANGGVFSVPSTVLLTSTEYYVDWYSNDYIYSNWVNRTDMEEIFNPTITPGPGTNTTTKLVTIQNYARILCLNGGGTGTKWKAVDGYTFLYSGGSRDSLLWSQLPQSRKKFEIQFHKDFSMTYSYIADNGEYADITEFLRTPPDGTPNGTTAASMYLYENASRYDMNGQLNSNGVITYYLTAPAGATEAAVADTIMVNINNVGFYKMVRE